MPLSAGIEGPHTDGCDLQKGEMGTIPILKRYGDYTWVECKLEAGRTHQILCPHGLYPSSCRKRSFIWL